MYQNEIALESAAAAELIAETLLTEGHYVVMISREENLWIVNYEYSHYRSRNDVVFMSREEYEKEMFNNGCEDVSES